MSRTAYLVGMIDFKKDPPVVYGAGIFGEAHPTIAGIPIVLMEITAEDWQTARDNMAKAIRNMAERMPKHHYAQWCLKQLEADEKRDGR